MLYACGGDLSKAKAMIKDHWPRAFMREPDFAPPLERLHNILHWQRTQGDVERALLLGHQAGRTEEKSKPSFCATTEKLLATAQTTKIAAQRRVNTLNARKEKLEAELRTIAAEVDALLPLVR
jgi:hypothetical protein